MKNKMIDMSLEWMKGTKERTPRPRVCICAINSMYDYMLSESDRLLRVHNPGDIEFMRFVFTQRYTLDRAQTYLTGILSKVIGEEITIQMMVSDLFTYDCDVEKMEQPLSHKDRSAIFMLEVIRRYLTGLIETANMTEQMKKLSTTTDNKQTEESTSYLYELHRAYEVVHYLLSILVFDVTAPQDNIQDSTRMAVTQEFDATNRALIGIRAAIKYKSIK